MINLILLFPLIACLILFIFKRVFEQFNDKYLCNFAFLVSLSFCLFGQDILPFASSSVFAVTPKNFVFLGVMSIVFFSSGYL